MLASVRKSSRFFSDAPALSVFIAITTSSWPAIRMRPLHTSPNSPGQKHEAQLSQRDRATLVKIVPYATVNVSCCSLNEVNSSVTSSDMLQTRKNIIFASVIQSHFELYLCLFQLSLSYKICSQLIHVYVKSDARDFTKLIKLAFSVSFDVH